MMNIEQLQEQKLVLVARVNHLATLIAEAQDCVLQHGRAGSAAFDNLRRVCADVIALSEQLEAPATPNRRMHADRSPTHPPPPRPLHPREDDFSSQLHITPNDSAIDRQAGVTELLGLHVLFVYQSEVARLYAADCWNTDGDHSRGESEAYTEAAKAVIKSLETLGVATATIG